MIEVNKQVLIAMMEAIVREINPERIILFGSHARGDAKIGSDIDLLIIEGEPFGHGHNRREEMARVRKALSKFRIPKDILIYSKDEIKKWHNSVNHVISHCLREGKVLYERH